MKPKSVIYVGPAMSGRRTSLAAVIGSRGIQVDPLTMNPHGPYEFDVGDGCRIAARVSSFRASLYYEDADDPRFNAGVRMEVGWLCDADGILFVIDSQEARGPANEDEFTKLRRDLAHRGVDLNDKPIVFQANKRDLDEPTSLDVLRETFRVRRCSYVESVAPKGIGTTEAVLALADLMRDT